MKHYVSLQTTELWNEPEPLAKPAQAKSSKVVFVLATAVMVAPVLLTYLAWNPSSPVHNDLVQWFENIKFSIGL